MCLYVISNHRTDVNCYNRVSCMRLRLSFILLLLYALPIVLICTGVIPFAYRYELLLLMAIVAGIVSWRAGHTSALHGLRLDNLGSSLRLNGFFLILAALGVSALLLFGPGRHSLNIPGF